MAHSHEHTHKVNYNKAFAIGIALNIGFVAVEVFYGILANSSALLADAGHNAGDVLSLIFAWTAARLATIKPKGKYTYGLRKTTILVSVLNALLLFAAVIAIAWDAVGKFKNPEPAAGTQIMIVAGIGVIINIITALMFMKGRKGDLNIKGAFLHMSADAAVSFGVVIAGLLINLTGKFWIDPGMSFVIIAVILWGTWRLFTDSVNLALDAVPKHINIEDVRNFLLSQKEVENIHDLHIWAMSTTQVALTVHLKMSGKQDNNFIIYLQEELRHQFKINHTTFQIENAETEENCSLNH